MVNNNSKSIFILISQIIIKVSLDIDVTWQPKKIIIHYICCYESQEINECDGFASLHGHFFLD